MSEVWRYATSGAVYDTEKAKRLMLQLPVALLGPCNGKSDIASVYVTGKRQVSTYDIVLKKIAEEVVRSKSKKDSTQLVKNLVSIAESEAERERIKYTAAAVTNSSPNTSVFLPVVKTLEQGK